VQYEECLPRPEVVLCIKEEAILTREGEAVKLSSPAAEDTTTCTNSQSETGGKMVQPIKPGGEMEQPIKTRSGGGRNGLRIRHDLHNAEHRQQEGCGSGSL
jgi:hypothetical protein